MGLELQSLALYVVAAINRDSTRSTEAGLKYFRPWCAVVGHAALRGIAGLRLHRPHRVQTKSPPRIDRRASARSALIFGLVFLLAGLAFKISAVPFHMWTPDVYEGAPTPVTAFFAAAPKMAAMALFVRIVIDAFEPVTLDWQQIVVFISIASMVLGAFAAIGQKNIKRLMAYSSIAHMGFALVGLAAGSQAGVRGVILYMLIYMVMTLGTFACILAMRRKDEGNVEQIDDLAGLSSTNPFMALMLTILMFSLAGIPPLAGFFGKYVVFVAADRSQALRRLRSSGCWPLLSAPITTCGSSRSCGSISRRGNFAPVAGELKLVFGDLRAVRAVLCSWSPIRSVLPLTSPRKHFSSMRAEVTHERAFFPAHRTRGCGIHQYRVHGARAGRGSEGSACGSPPTGRPEGGGGVAEAMGFGARQSLCVAAADRPGATRRRWQAFPWRSRLQSDDAVSCGAAGRSAAQTLRIKWPNDLLISGGERPRAS
jgi:hypothetical protein